MRVSQAAKRGNCLRAVLFHRRQQDDGRSFIELLAHFRGRGDAVRARSSIANGRQFACRRCAGGRRWAVQFLAPLGRSGQVCLMVCLMICCGHEGRRRFRSTGCRQLASDLADPWRGGDIIVRCRGGLGSGLKRQDAGAGHECGQEQTNRTLHNTIFSVLGGRSSPSMIIYAETGAGPRQIIAHQGTVKGKASPL